MKIRVNNVEGGTSKKGAKQNKVYAIVSQGSKETVLPNGTVCDLSDFYKATDEKGNPFELWNIHGDFSRLGIRKQGKARYSYTSNFIVTE